MPNILMLRKDCGKTGQTSSTEPVITSLRQYRCDIDSRAKDAILQKKVPNFVGEIILPNAQKPKNAYFSICCKERETR